MIGKISGHIAAATAAILAAAWLLVAHSATAQSSTHVSTKGGFQAEEVRVGSSCVVVVWGGNVEQFTAVPCR